ncbi:hypothetical protein ACFWUZ_09000 [Streptomyces sp. NPDC058646]|uniref:hypothetical protein n=1 Tax=Streptomyces sp. NPDC058646 TaxID=3346574 RepID=UPI00365C3AF5
MDVILSGATGMIGRGALRACLRDDAVRSVPAASCARGAPAVLVVAATRHN